MMIVHIIPRLAPTTRGCPGFVHWVLRTPWNCSVMPWSPGTHAMNSTTRSKVCSRSSGNCYGMPRELHKHKHQTQGPAPTQAQQALSWHEGESHFMTKVPSVNLCVASFPNIRVEMTVSDEHAWQSDCTMAFRCCGMRICMRVYNVVWWLCVHESCHMNTCPHTHWCKHDHMQHINMNFATMTWCNSWGGL